MFYSLVWGKWLLLSSATSKTFYIYLRFLYVKVIHTTCMFYFSNLMYICVKHNSMCTDFQPYCTQYKMCQLLFKEMRNVCLYCIMYLLWTIYVHIYWTDVSFFSSVKKIYNFKDCSCTMDKWMTWNKQIRSDLFVCGLNNMGYFKVKCHGSFSFGMDIMLRFVSGWLIEWIYTSNCEWVCADTSCWDRRKRVLLHSYSGHCAVYMVNIARHTVKYNKKKAGVSQV